ncbi:DUF2860 family protein [Pseudomonas sp. SL4(2022)]|uniref:DUF2860 family protein n=1 Tax=Pseudomonas sp. SL4(2022) TaxID=2994661 RepID=UPI002270937F|nr:DUF2860 family protein [Pseudomonas sp. SL4(2022)]WAC46456.1 DUF2860 family protein [Pseudomonas sp. SL4(2022)]
MRKLVCVAIGSAMALSAQAHDKIGEKDGLTGYGFLGVSTSLMETNTTATIGGTDVGDRRIGSLTRSPDSQGYGGLVPAFNLTYTFAGSRTQIFGGTELEDFLSQDSTFGLGVRQGAGSLGNLRVSLLAGTRSEVWQDPYVVNASRRKTDRKSSGVRLGWEHILESDFAVTLSNRKIKLDDELSGTALGLTAAQSKLLVREGNQKKADLSYRWMPNANHVLIPTISVIDYDLDGEAMAMKGTQLELNYAYLGLQDWELIASGLVGSLESNKTNPIYGKKQELDRMGVSLGATYKEPFGLKDWKASATLNYGQEDSNIDFYNTRIKSLTVGMLYSF